MEHARAPNLARQSTNDATKGGESWPPGVLRRADRVIDLDNPISFSLSTATTILFVVDPIAAVPVFLSMTATDPPGARERIAIRASIASFAILCAFAAVGGAIFQLLHISIGAFRIAGGLLLFLLAVDMLRAQRSRQRTSPEEEAEGIEKSDVSIFPLAIPILAGPGATSAVMVLVSRATEVWQYLVVLGALVITAVVTYATFRGASSLARLLGQTGLGVIQRVMGLILAATAVQFVVDGISSLLPAMTAALSTK
jgi:multiple antibiotic resistance protein